MKLFSKLLNWIKHPKNDTRSSANFVSDNFHPVRSSDELFLQFAEALASYAIHGIGPDASDSERIMIASQGFIKLGKDHSITDQERQSILNKTTEIIRKNSLSW